MENKKISYALNVSVAGVIPSLDTQLLFNKNFKETKLSSIDEFSERIQELNKRCPPPLTPGFDQYQAQIFLLGIVAAVESYIRSIFRKIILMDKTAQEAVHDKTVSYGAALHLPPELLPEALLEKTSFTSHKNIVEAIRDLLAVKGNIPSSLDEAISAYVKVCHLRHCAVHRFGKLGTNNAIALGLNDHKEMLEKPMQLSYEALQICISVSVGFVKVLNNHLFNEILSRVPLSTWTGNYKNDKSQFKIYYELFVDKKSSLPSPQLRSLYSKMKTQINVYMK